MPFSVRAPESGIVIGFSRQPSVADFLKRTLETAGFHAAAVWSTIEDLEIAISRLRPAAVVYEVGFPFDEHWKEFVSLKDRRSFNSTPMVVATAVPPETYRRVGATAVLEIFTRPSGRAVRDAVRSATLNARPATPTVDPSPAAPPSRISTIGLTIGAA
jgi:hypothetical protein